MTLAERMANKLGRKAIYREFEVLYTLYHHESLPVDEIPHHLDFPECRWLETTLDDLKCLGLIETQPPNGNWIYLITDKGKALMRDELLRLSRWYVYKAYLITTTACGVGLFDAARNFDDFVNQGIFDGFEDVNTETIKEDLC